MNSEPPPTQPGFTPLGVLYLSLGVLLLIAILAGFSSPLVLRSAKRSDLTSALVNARQIGLALMEFDTEYGRFPDAQTALDVASRTRSKPATPGTSANAHLRQLLAAGIIQSETAFYSLTAFSRKPDNVFDSPDTALAPGELGFGYILNGDTALDVSDLNPSIPVLVAPLAFDGKTVSPTHFDPDIFDGRMILLRIDNSASMHTIEPSTRNLLIDGKSWLATGGDTVWGSKINPRVATPVPK